jgi:NADH:ubiquinone reductase (H+-translocating)
MKKVVILGGGFAGLMTARHLVRLGAVKNLCEVTVIDAADAHVYTPWLYEAATGALRGETLATKTAMLQAASLEYKGLPGFEGVRFLKKIIQHVNFDSRHIEVEGKRLIPYDILVITLGAVPNYFGIPGLPEQALNLKRLDDAQRIHDAVMTLADSATSAKPKYITIAGAGPNGIEFVCELANTVKILERHDKLEPGSIKITLIDTATEVLTILPKTLRRRAARRLTSLGVELRSGLRVSEVGKGFVTAFTQSGKSHDQVRIPADLCIWSGGVKVNSLLEDMLVMKDDRGRIVLENTCAIASYPNVFAAGDCAALINPHTGKADPQSAYAAHYYAHTLAKNVYRCLRQRPMMAIGLPKRWAFLSALGGAWAVGTMFGLRFWGYPAFVLRRVADLYYFLNLLPPFYACRVWLKGVSLYHKNDR